MDQQDAKPYGTAVVIGASIAGLSAAAALSGQFDHVIVLDADALPEVPQNRRGVPHGHQYHGLTVGGRDAIEDLLPGFTAGANRDGIPLIDPSVDFKYRSKFGWWPRHPSKMRMLQATRTYFEWNMRQLASSVPNISIREKHRALGLIVENGTARGVRVRRAGAVGDEAVSADFVVDASGRGSATPSWLAALGLPAPTESTVDAKWGYTSTYVRRPKDWNPGYTSILVNPTISGSGPTATRGGAMWTQENDMLVVTATGCAGDYPPGDLEGLRDFLGTIAIPDLRHALDNYEVIAPVLAWRNTRNRLRDYVNLSARLENFLVIGDAGAAFNPVYGQGMAAAAISARILRDALADHSGADLAGFAGTAQKLIFEKIVAPCWMFSTGSDFGVPGVEIDGQPKPDGKSEQSEFMDRVMALSVEDEAVHSLLLETSQLVRGVEWLGDPQFLARIGAEWDRLGQAALQTATN
jgi:2-polyprenyl-6-methoxyphenol hydroxylase-like FAD-dependent oxidoreductase